MSYKNINGSKTHIKENTKTRNFQDHIQNWKKFENGKDLNSNDTLRQTWNISLYIWSPLMTMFWGIVLMVIVKFTVNQYLQILLQKIQMKFASKSNLKISTLYCNSSLYFEERLLDNENKEKSRSYSRNDKYKERSLYFSQKLRLKI